VSFIAGSTRSGTTWLAEVLNSTGENRLYFEPFDLFRNPELGAFGRHHYLPADSPAVEEAGPIQRVIEGQVHHRRVVEHNHVTSPRPSTSLLIKDVWANLLLPWIARQYPDLDVVFLVRSPLAVARSRLRLGWSSHLTDMTNQERLMAALEPQADLIRSAKSPFERQVVAWAIDNRIPLTQVRSGRLTVVRYEDIVSDPESELARICDGIGATSSPAMIERLPVRSMTDWPIDPGATSFHDHRASERSGPAERRFVARVLASFELDHLYPDLA
jgi:hypothetical protein